MDGCSSRLAVSRARRWLAGVTSNDCNDSVTPSQHVATPTPPRDTGASTHVCLTRANISIQVTAEENLASIVQQRGAGWERGA